MIEFLQALLISTAVASALAAALLLLGPALNKRFAPQWRYWAWLLVAARLAVPFHVSLPQAPIRIETPGLAATQGESAVAGPMTVYAPPEGETSNQAPHPAPAVPAAPAQAAPPQSAAPIDWAALLVALWGLGAVGFLLYQVSGYLVLRRRVLRLGRYVEDSGGLPVWECPGLPSPILLGFVRPIIALPEGLGGETRAFALLHETTHHRRRDLWYKLLLVWCNALHWFNPLAWALRRAAAGDMEIACDAALLKDRDEDYRRAYGGALLDQVAPPRQPGASLTSAFSGGKGGLRRRVLSLLDMKPRRAGRLALSLLCAAALLGGSLVACETGGADASSGDEKTFPAVIYDMGWGVNESPDPPPTALVFRPIDVTDLVTGAGYYYPLEGNDSSGLVSLPIAKDAPYTGFPTTLPNSTVQMHPGVALRMTQMLSALARPPVPAILTVKGGVVVDLSPFDKAVALEPGESISFVYGVTDGTGTVQYVNDFYGFTLDIPEETARNLVVLTAQGGVPGVGAEGYDGPLPGSVIFTDRRLMGPESKGYYRNRMLPSYVVICRPLALGAGPGEGQGDNEKYSFSTALGADKDNTLARIYGLTPEDIKRIEGDQAVMAGLTPRPTAPAELYFVEEPRYNPTTRILSGRYLRESELIRRDRDYPMDGTVVLMDGDAIPQGYTGDAIQWMVDHWTEFNFGTPGLPVVLARGVVTQIGLEPYGTLLERFVPDSLVGVYMGSSPDDGDESDISWYNLNLSFHFEGYIGEELDSTALTYRLEFEDDSPMLELMGINPFHNAHPDGLVGDQTKGSVNFITGRSPMTEEEFEGHFSGDTGCTLVVTDPATGAERSFPMEAVLGGGQRHLRPAPASPIPSTDVIGNQSADWRGSP